MPTNPRMQVVSVDTSSRRWTVLAALIAGVIVLVGGYAVGRIHAGQIASSLSDELARESAQVETLTGVRDQLADVELDRTIDAGASEILRATIKQQKDEIAQLQEQVNFFQRLMAPGSAPRGVMIDRVELSRAGDAFEYYVLLTQLEDRRSWVSGLVVIDVIGQRGGAQQVLSLTELTEVDSYPIKYRFRYFQDFSGSLSLPDGFEPSAIRVRADQSSGKDNLEREFAWDAALQGVQ
ncbi:MAG: hypothetical protein NXH85_15055 [Pseudomonadaceae bacterium]|nr:hypothetical protein [Pseudomonadaceae bacterium]